MRTFEMKAVPSIKLSRRSISRFIAALLAISILQFAGVFQAPSSFGAAGYVGPTTGSGTCSSYVGEAIGVTATFVNDSFCLIKFNNSTTWTSPTGVRSFETLLVGGGGGGGADGGGGGGGGEVRLATSISVADGAVSTITIAGGGAGNSHTPGIAGGNGGTSSVVVNSTTYSANGGSVAVGWLNSANYAAGGSGGSNGTQLTGGTDYSKGGRNSVQANGYALGGYGTVGFAGVTTSFTGTSLTFAGGGGGGICTDTKSESSFGGLAGGSGGGGRGAFHTQNVGSDAGQPGTNGLGGGGGGGSACNDGGTNGSNARTAGGRGGDGVVYIKFVPVISITTNPQSASGTVGGTTTFSATPYAALTGATRTKKWQVLVPNGSWSDISGATSDSYTTPTITRAMHGNQYRYVVTDTVGTAVSTTISSAATLTVPAPLLLGETDTALTFVGNQYAEVADGTGTPFDMTGSLTIEAWVYPTSTCASDQGVVSKLNSYMLYCGGGFWKYVLDADGLNWSGSLSTIAVRPNEWHHIAYTHSSSSTDLLIYIDGVLVQTVNSGVTTLAANNDNFQVGRYSSGNNFQGSIDEVRVYNSQRTAAQISADLKNYGPTSDANLKVYYDFNEGTGAILYNRVPDTNATSDLVISGSPTFTDVKTVEISGPYTRVTFPRTYINSVGGWKQPTGISRATVLVVGGGGGGGGQYASQTGETAGGGGGGGVFEIGPYLLSASTYVPVVVGVGGVGGSPSTDRDGVTYGKRGGTTSFNTTLTAGGGGGGGYTSNLQMDGAAGTAGGGGGGSTGYWNAYNQGAGGTGSSITNGGVTYSGRTGGTGQTWTGSYSGAGGGAGGAATTTAPGAGVSSSIAGSSVEYGRGGTSQAVTTPAYVSTPIAAGNGGDGYRSANANGGYGVGGANGLVVVRYITATKPIFTQPTIDTTTAGLVDTITVSSNPISPLTRNYLWQSSSDTGTTWTNISTGSGFLSQTYTTPILETTTSGLRYQYRVVVTDSDTAGLFITDTSTAVYVVVNPRITIAGTYTILKYGAAHTDTFTVGAATGTGTKTLSFTPNNRSGISWNSAIANTAALSIAATLKPGTYYETLTATDTKGATTSLSLAIVVNKADTITVTSIAITDTYTGSALTFNPSYTISGLVNSDTVTAMNWSFSGTDNSATSYGASATKPVNAGAYTITPVPTILNSDSYTAVVINTSALTINRAARTISMTTTPSSLKFGSSSTLLATPSAGGGDGTIIYTSSTTSLCTVSGSNLTAIQSSGRCNFGSTISRGNNFETATVASGSVSLSKADSITVTVNAIAPLTYTASPAVVTPTVTVTGLVNSNTASLTPVTYTYVAGASFGSTCATGGTCSVGDIGPGGGKVFYVASSQQSWGRYLEAAPTNWSGGADNQASNVTKWCIATSSVDGTIFGTLPDGVGQGYANTYNTALNVCTGGAIYNAKSYRGAGYSNWYLPTGAELALMAQPSIRTTLGLVDDLAKWGYWGSNEGPTTGYIGSLVTSSWAIGATVKSESSNNFTRPIRAFSAGEAPAVTYSTPPTDADTYTVQASALTLSSGSLSDYLGVSYVSGTLRINRAQQSPLVIAQYGATFGTPYKIQLFGGSGTGALIQNVSAGSAQGCSISGDTLTSTTVGTCLVTVTKALDKNYETATVTSSIYFLSFTLNQPATVVSSGTGLGLSGKTSVTLDPNVAPTISSLSAYTATPGSTQIIISGSGFDHLSPSLITVKFWRNVIASGFTVNAGDSQITVTVPVGATTGKVTVTTPNGLAISEQPLTITP